MPLSKVAIIGTAGRSDPFLTKENFLIMQQVAKNIITSDFGLEKEQVCAAWSEHIAVTLFNDDIFDKLELYLPCLWGKEKFPDKRWNW